MFRSKRGYNSVPLKAKVRGLIRGEPKQVVDTPVKCLLKEVLDVESYNGLLYPGISILRVDSTSSNRVPN